jgi:hypothetical protein
LAARSQNAQSIALRSGARTDRLLERNAIEPARDLRAERHDALGDAFERLAIARIGHALAAAAVFAIGKLRDHDRRFGLGAAADCKRADNRPALDTHGKGRHRQHPREGRRPRRRFLRR